MESVYKGRVARRANAGTQQESLTTQVDKIFYYKYCKNISGLKYFLQYRQYIVSDGNALDANKRNIKFRFCDSMGLEGDSEKVGKQLTSSDMAKIMDGYVENMAEVCLHI